MIVVDVEASGTEYHLHSILSIGALDLHEPENRFYAECRMWDGAHVMPDALAVNGFTEEEIYDPQKQTEAEAVCSFLAWARKIPERTLAGQNVSFDRDFLKAATERAGEAWPLAYRTIDTHTLAYMHHIQRGITPPTKQNHSGLDLDAILEYVGIPEEPQPHNALTGALSHAEVVSRLLFEKPLLPEFNAHPIPWQRA